MSLQALINLRTRHHVAPASIWVLVGNAPKWIEDCPSMVTVRPGDKNFDFRALVGLHVAVIELGSEWATLERVIEAIELAKPKTISLACESGISGLNADHELCLERARRLFWNI